MDEKNVVIYCRVSTKEQAEEGNSLVTQEKICREYAIRCGFVISKVFIEFGESAKTANRTELQNMLMFCSKKQNKIKAVIIYKVDRLARNVDDYSDIRMRLKNYGAVICSTSEQFDGNPAGRFMENILANVAQFDNDVRTERSVNGMKEAVRTGRYIWPAPYGYQNGIINGKSNIIPVPDVANLIQKAFSLIISDTLSQEQIWMTLTKEGLKLSRSQFYKMVRNKMYCGIIEKFKETNMGTYEPIISKETFETAGLALKMPRRLLIPYNTHNPDFPLRRFVKHPSGIKLTGGWSKSRSGKKFPYYRFGIKKHNFRKEDLENKFIDFLDCFSFDRNHLMHLRQHVDQLINKGSQSREIVRNDLEKKLTDLRIKQSEILNKNLKGFISDTFLKSETESIELEIFKIKQNLELPNNLKPLNLEEIFSGIEEFLINPGLFWKKADFALKTSLQRFKFPQGVTFDGEVFRTTETALIFKEKEAYLGKKSHVVPHRKGKLNLVDSHNTLPSKKKLLEVYLPEFIRLKEEVFDKAHLPHDDYPI